jgi:predicted lysophospholipase L1 biosynthesis ABC-type transport system permease subunit
VVAAGAVLGLGLAYAAGRVLASLFPDLKPADPALLGLATLVLALAAVLACWAPVRCAASAEPAKVLRGE